MSTVLTVQVKDEVMDYLVASCSRLAISQSDTGGAVDVQVSDVQTLTGLNVSAPAPGHPSHIMFSTRSWAISIVVSAMGLNHCICNGLHASYPRSSLLWTRSIGTMMQGALTSQGPLHDACCARPAVCTMEESVYDATHFECICYCQWHRSRSRRLLHCCYASLQNAA